MNARSPFNPPLLTEKDHRTEWGSLHGSSVALAIAELASQQDRPVCVITTDIQQARRWQHALTFFAQDRDLSILRLPDWETLPYDHFSPHADLISQRLRTLYQLNTLKQGVLITALPTILHRLMPKADLLAHAFLLKIQDNLALEPFRQQLIASGYRAADQVMEHGEFALRGSIVDIFPMGSDTPFRIELFDEKIESIRPFDPESQRSQPPCGKIELLPAREYPLTEAAIAHFRTAWRAQFSGNPLDAPAYTHLSQGEPIAGIEYYLPLFYPALDTLFDYLPKNTSLIFESGLHDVAEHTWATIQSRYEQLRHDITHPLCEPSTLYLSPDDFFAKAKSFSSVRLSSTPGKHVQFSTQPTPDVTVNHKSSTPLSALSHFLPQVERTLICAESSGRREVVLDLLREHAIKPELFEHWADFLASQAKIGLTVAPLDQGFVLDTPRLAVITETQLFGEQVKQRRQAAQRVQDPASLIRNLTELHQGAPVVHLVHGVGRYRGLTHLSAGDVEAEYLILEYDNEDIVYVPVSALHLISRYTGTDPEHAPLHRLGSKAWEKAKKSAQKRVRDTAAELLKLYSQRATRQGFAFILPRAEYEQFSQAFPFEETPDQAQAIQAVIQDMTQARCMDRLVCGDVGFGKTEVAMRAAFVAAHSGKQVAVLVPTTLLANQHLDNFRDRFADWPIKVAGLSRLRTTQEQNEALKGLREGTVDIVIGTHKLLGQDVKFKNLGLLIIDEEHRFGVRHKERIKALRAEVDILTLTATPIPRTLNMALSGTRDLSIIATPPVQRLSVKTFLHAFNEALVREAISRETLRGGQVYFLHNRVETIHATAEKLQRIAPQARIAIAHGQLPERELERIMFDFYHQKFNVLLCTTIIESGIDIPNANTILIDRADRFGLAQLHQIRGRVGRSHHQAYAYLLVSDTASLTRDAKKRLEAITALEDLGAGFHLATHDLEIRGAGELLGEAQSGHIQTIGFSLFMEMLEEAIESLKQGKEPTFTEAQEAFEIDFHVTALIPETYVPDIGIRLTLYKRLSDCHTAAALSDFKAELIDRFGALPDATDYLLQLTRLRHLCEPLGVKKLDVGARFGYVQFVEQPNINPARIIELIQKAPDTYQLQGSDRLRFTLSEGLSHQARMATVEKMIHTLRASS